MNLDELRRILIIDDNPDIHDDYRKVLTVSENDHEGADALGALLGAQPDEQPKLEFKLEVDSAFQGKDGLEKVKQAIKDGQPYSLAFVDLRMPPGWGGLKTIEEIWRVAPELQIVICSAYSDNAFGEICEKFGATDNLLILKKPFDSVEVKQLAIALTEKWILGKKARVNQEDLERLVDERTEQLKLSVQRDPLTKIANRNRFNEFLDVSMKRCKRYRASFALVLLDLDHFKQINDTLGHPAGDELLVQLSHRLKKSVRETDLIARLGGDEFGIILSEIEEAACIMPVLDRLREFIAEPFTLDSNHIECTTSIGIAVADGDSDCDSLMRKADLALYSSKNAGRNTFRFYETNMQAEFVKIRELEMDLKNAVDRQEFELYFQPICDIDSGHPTSFEALIRWNHPTKGVIEPADFLPLCERNGMIEAIDQWVLESACESACSWPTQFSVAINVSPIQFRNHSDSYFELVDRVLKSTGLDPGRLEIEVTESMLIQDLNESVRQLSMLKELGIAITLDDFGVGYSSLSHIRRFPFDKLKLDRSFVADEDADAMMELISGLSENLGMALTFEGVENEKQLKRVKQFCDHATIQGYYFGRPGKADHLTKWFSTAPKTPYPTIPNDASTPEPLSN